MEQERQKMGYSETEKFVSSLRSTFSSLEVRLHCGCSHPEGLVGNL